MQGLEKSNKTKIPYVLKFIKHPHDSNSESTTKSIFKFLNLMLFWYSFESFSSLLIPLKDKIEKLFQSSLVYKLPYQNKTYDWTNVI